MYPLIIVPEIYKDLIKSEVIKSKIKDFKTVQKASENQENIKSSKTISSYKNILVQIVVVAIVFYFNPMIAILLAIAILYLNRNHSYNINYSKYEKKSNIIETTKLNDLIFIKDFDIVENTKVKELDGINVENRNIYLFGQSGLPKKGVTENYFYKFLENYFGKLVTNSFDMRIKFYPDFILIDELNKIKIAIEIDEPYSFELRKPIHLKNSHDYKHSVYGNNGWFVIRFAEEQIVRYPEKCCEEIVNLRNKIIIKVNLSELSKTKHSAIIKEEWDESEAKFYEKNKLREKYLTEFGIKY